MLIPYITKVVGNYEWGIYSFIQAYGLYISAIIEYGFSLSASRDISQNRENSKIRGTIFSSVFTTQLFLILLLFLITFFLQFYIDIFDSRKKVLWIAFAAYSFQGINLLWYFQGLEKMKFVAILDFFTKLFAFIMVLVLVNKKQDTWLIFFSFLCANIITFTITIFIVMKSIKFNISGISTIFSTLKSGFSLFLVRINGLFFSAGNTFILGFAVAPEYVGYFSAAEKIANSIRGLFSPIIRAIYPRMNHLVLHAPNKALKLLKKELIILFILGIVLTLSIYFFAELIIELYLGIKFYNSIPVLKTLSFIPPVIAVNLILGSHWLLSKRKDRLYTKISFITTFVNLILTILCINIFPSKSSVIFVALSMVLAQIFQLIWLLKITVSQNSNLNIFNKIGK